METLDRYVGKLLDRRYRIRRVIGVGGMAVVFEATDLVMNRIVAIKMLKDEMSQDEVAVKRFINESKAVSMLSHPNIVKIFDMSVKGPVKYFVMERVEGITLKSYMHKKGALSTEEVLSYSEQVLKALEHAHAKGIVHRDIKPQNILLLKNGRVKVTDFGIAVLEEGDVAPSNEKAIGTVYYISPEQASGKEIDQRSDLYSLGVMMYEMATGTLPFNAETPISVAMMQVREQPKNPTDIKSDIPKGLEQVILGAMEKSPERRFQNAEQMLRYVSRLRDNHAFIFKTRKPTPEDIHTGREGILDTDMAHNRKKNRRRRAESRSMFPIIFGVATAFLVVFITSAITILDLVLKDQSLNAPFSVKVPNVTGDIYDEDMMQLFDSSIYKVIIKTKNSNSIPKNTVISQDPEPGASRNVIKNQQYCEITLTISAGAVMLTIPDFSITDYRDAQDRAERLGLVPELRQLPSDTVEVGYVLYTEPAARSTVAEGSTLVIYYSAGAKIQKVSVPVLTGMTPKEAYKKMNNNFKVGDVTEEYSDTVPAGSIISQSIASGTEVVKGTVIHFVLSLGPAPETEPPDTGLPGDDLLPEDDLLPDEPDWEEPPEPTE